ncbi:RING1 and YY1-binding protein [Heterocephalus glaber]|uniref:RING1 and YY1-binding protein n=1 Tax=Heterocephalus glaber TaxID=10181 RepID=G5AMI6_HETGA|nr:RING1 and YY1-binding protein [Heterocephalus glaber]
MGASSTPRPIEMRRHLNKSQNQTSRLPAETPKRNEMEYSATQPPGLPELATKEDLEKMKSEIISQICPTEVLSHTEHAELARCRQAGLPMPYRGPEWQRTNRISPLQTGRNSAEASKCSICDLRKGTSTRKPRINSQLVAQVAQQYATPPPQKKEKKEKVEKRDKEKPEKDKEISPSVTKKNTNKKTKPKSDILKDPPSGANSIQSANATTKTSKTNHTSRLRLKNVDRSTAQQLTVTVGNVTVIITDFKEKTHSSLTSSSTGTSSAGSEQQNQRISGSESTDKRSSRSSNQKATDTSAVNDESF